MATPVMPEDDHEVPGTSDHEDGTSPSWRLVLPFTDLKIALNGRLSLMTFLRRRMHLGEFHGYPHTPHHIR
jgi:hypothetical protein